jgi:6-hydroxymethylpterin diphosphokinase MptE-like protein
MIAWTEKFPSIEKPLGYCRLLKARHRYFDRLALRLGGRFGLRWNKISGYQQRLADLRDTGKGKRCFIIANGPSIRDQALARLKDDVTIGCNGIYRLFGEWGFHTDYLLLEDIDQIEARRRKLPKVQGPLKMAAIYNAYAFAADDNTVFFNAPRMDNHGYYWTDIYPQFSRDFASIVHLGSTITFAMIELAYHLGCDPVYLVGLDHDYDSVLEAYPPGPMTIDSQNMEKVRGLHFLDDYYREGDRIYVPLIDRMEASYRLAREVFEEEGRTILNASARTKLDVFDRVSFDTLFEG